MKTKLEQNHNIHVRRKSLLKNMPAFFFIVAPHFRQKLFPKI